MRRHVLLQGAAQGVVTDADRASLLVQTEAERGPTLAQGPQLALGRQSDGGVRSGTLIFCEPSQIVFLAGHQQHLCQSRPSAELTDAGEPLSTILLLELESRCVQKVTVVNGFSVGYPDAVHHAVSVEDVHPLLGRKIEGIGPHARVHARQVVRDLAGLHPQGDVFARGDWDHGPVELAHPCQRLLDVLKGIQETVHQAEQEAAHRKKATGRTAGGWGCHGARRDEGGRDGRRHGASEARR
mmetsp:Transcript_10391/g.16611  ORF Transcript_10391/g.16611 Transcript_10391/m.16611 type:complete len:241 (-) Transcript_10391:26-748(-)